MALDLSGYKLTFEDEFNSFSRYTGAAGSGTWKTWFYFGDRTLNGNGERQYYMDQDFKGSSSKPLGVKLRRTRAAGPTTATYIKHS